MQGAASTTLVVFSDDWGRHPSSCQHLVRHLLPTHDVLWVNTIGMRRVKLTAGDAKRAAGRLGQWGGGAKPQAANPKVVSPVMYPGFRRSWQRRFNAQRIARVANRALRSRKRQERIAVTTLPIAADLVGPLDVDRWVYYCVDDFSVWPGLDGRVMDAMERELVGKVDAVMCASQVLRERIGGFGREAELLTHGVDVDHWRPSAEAPHVHAGLRDGGHALFWGLLDARLDLDWLLELVDAKVALTLCGPGSFHFPFSRRLNAVPYDRLSDLAATADVLVMPYVDAPVTRAMQPLKLLEYLATYKPVVVRDLPATREWADCCDVVSTADEFVRVCLERAKTGLPESQLRSRRRRLPGESWSEKARRFEAILHGFSRASR